MSRQTLFEIYGIENNPLSVTWHWQPSDDVDIEAFYEPVDGKGIAWRVPWRWGKTPNSSSPSGFADIQLPDYSAADFKIVDPLPEITIDNTDIPQDLSNSVGDGWELMRVSDVELVVWQQQFDLDVASDDDGSPFRITGPRTPDAPCVARFLSVDGDARS